jgi:hypothetical protein
MDAGQGDSLILWFGRNGHRTKTVQNLTPEWPAIRK